MKITYAIWQGSRLLSVGNEATSIKDVDKVIKELNDSEIASKNKFTANIQEVKVGK
jgi:hypothetical protein